MLTVTYLFYKYFWLPLYNCQDSGTKQVFHGKIVTWRQIDSTNREVVFSFFPLEVLFIALKIDL